MNVHRSVASRLKYAATLAWFPSLVEREMVRQLRQRLIDVGRLVQQEQPLPARRLRRPAHSRSTPARPVDHLPKHTPGVVVAVVRGDEVAAAWAAGAADAVTGRPMSLDSACNWFSMTKIATATAAMLLVENGSMDLDAPVSRYLGDVWPAGLHGARVRHLLSHSSGLANPIPIRWVHPAGQPNPDPAMFLERVLCRQHRQHREPGTAARYSNIGYLALGQVIATAAGVPYEQFVHNQVLAPLEMGHTAFHWTDPALDGVSRATAHVRAPLLAAPFLSALLPAGVIGPRSGRVLTLRPFELDGAAYGGLIGTVTDAARLLAVFTNAGTVGSVRLLSAASVEAMTTIVTPGRPYDLGLGWFRPHGEHSGQVEHLGGGIGYFNILRLDVAGRRGAAVMSNTTSHWDISGFADHAVAAALGQAPDESFTLPGPRR